MSGLTISRSQNLDDWDAVRVVCRAYFDHLMGPNADAAPVMAEAKAAGYEKVYLDTMHFLTPAIQLYLGLGFRPRAGYLPAHTELGALVRCFEKDL